MLGLNDAGPYYWVQYTLGEPIPHSRPNEGSVRGRKNHKRMEQRAAFRSVHFSSLTKLIGIIWGLLSILRFRICIYDPLLAATV